MRRLTSISMALALLLSLASPLLAEACMHSGVQASCHRVRHVHHCEGMAADDEEISAPAPSESVSGAPSKCQMDCCIMAHMGKQTAVANSTTIPPKLAVSGKLHSGAIRFAATGYSSYTNRGPPAA